MIIAYGLILLVYREFNKIVVSFFYTEILSFLFSSTKWSVKIDQNNFMSGTCFLRLIESKLFQCLWNAFRSIMRCNWRHVWTISSGGNPAISTVGALNSCWTTDCWTMGTCKKQRVVLLLFFVYFCGNLNLKKYIITYILKK